ncbi:MAG: hypothetical protein JW908_08250 [Anaerolineales bacterium]|nr:hypothetical protein [Anaerolineales bacterium]
MKYNPNHQRKSIRLKGYDYTQTGACFVTMVTWQRECLFGIVDANQMRLNEFGKIVTATWEWLPAQYPYVEFGAWCVMPNHVHGIIIINGRDAFPGRDASRRISTVDSRRAPTTIDSRHDQMDIKIKPLGQLIGAFKTVSAKQINILRDSIGVPVWQRNFYEHIIQNEKEMQRIHTYIQNNPRNWKNDKENQ